MKVLAIGNSFSQDASRFLHQIAAADNFDLEINNLYIGGCSLERHWKNVEQNLADYSLEINGETSGRMVTSREMLARGDWDVVTLQQVSNYSGKFETFEPQLTKMSDFIRSLAPNARYCLHETWAYEQAFLEAHEPDYHTQFQMYLRIHDAYAKAQKLVDAAAIIPSGDVIQQLRALPDFTCLVQADGAQLNYSYGFTSAGMALRTKQNLCLTRDGFHLSYTYGRYAAGLTWYRKLTGRSVIGNSFVPAHEGCDPVDPAILAQIQQIAEQMV